MIVHASPAPTCTYAPAATPRCTGRWCFSGVLVSTAITMIRRTYLAWLAITVASPALLTLHVSHALPLILESSMGQAISVSAWMATMIRVSQYA